MMILVMPLFSVEVRLKDERVIRGQLMMITDTELYLAASQAKYRILRSSISFVKESIDNYNFCHVNIKFADGSTSEAELVMLSRDWLMYKTDQNINALHEVSLREIVSLNVIGVGNIRSDEYKRLAAADLSDILAATAQFVADCSVDAAKSVTSSEDYNNGIPSVENTDFYDKYWLRFNGLITRSTANELWDLIDIYTEKEKSLTLIYNEQLNNEKQKTEVRMSEISQELQSKIYGLRYEFAYRAYRIIVRAHDAECRDVSKSEISFGII
ncbi:MAG: hypothetical protein J6Y01_01325 [Spirochaetales bacterium]|nr:hypothetical protein [Spirochaetales bacterium]